MKMNMHHVQSFWLCTDVCAGVRHRSRVIYLGYGFISFIPKLAHMQYMVPIASANDQPAVAAAGVVVTCMLVAGVSGWYSMDAVAEDNFYILEDPSASRWLFKLCTYLTLACYLYPVLLFGHTQLVAEGFAVITACYYLVWAPMMDSSKAATCLVHLWCFMAFVRLAIEGAELTGPMRYCLVLYVVEGTVLRVMLTHSSHGLQRLEEASACGHSTANLKKKEFLATFARATSRERITSLEAFERIFARVETQKGCRDALAAVVAVRESWLHRRSLVRGQMIFCYHCIGLRQLRPEVIWHILEFAGAGIWSEEDACSDKDSASSSSLTSIDFVKRKLYSFLHPA